MKNAVGRSCLVAALFALVGSSAIAQTRIHALSGTVTSINGKIKMIEVETDDGSSAHFEWLKKSDGELQFDKNVSADAVTVDQFTGKGSRVILYYFGEGDVRTAVALRQLSAGPEVKSSGVVEKLNRHDHLLTIKNSAGAEETFRLDPRTVADTPNGVAQGFKFDLNKGDKVRVTAVSADGNETALLITPVY